MHVGVAEAAFSKMDYQNRFRETLNRKGEFGSSAAAAESDDGVRPPSISLHGAAHSSSYIVSLLLDVVNTMHLYRTAYPGWECRAYTTTALHFYHNCSHIV